jgi:FkbM family methyltransferase
MIKEIEGFEVSYRNEEETRRIVEEVFKDEEYKFVAETETPLIIDCGSHIGLSILYFKKIFSKAEILGFEPNRENFVILEKNIRNNHLENVRLINAALADKEGTNLLKISNEEKEPWTWGDSLVENIWGDNGTNKKMEVKTVKLSTYMDSPVDLLKIDVEGYEQKVIEEVKPKLDLVKEIILEYHLTPTMQVENSYAVIKKILESAGFAVEILAKNGEKFPNDFVPRKNESNQVYLVKAKNIRA